MLVIGMEIYSNYYDTLWISSGKSVVHEAYEVQFHYAIRIWPIQLAKFDYVVFSQLYNSHAGM